MVREVTFTEAPVQGRCGCDCTVKGEEGTRTSLVYPEGGRHAGLGNWSLETQD